MKKIKITVDMEPVAKARPRMNVNNGGVRSYTPEKTQNAQIYLSEALWEYMQENKVKMIRAYLPIKLTAVFYRTKSKWAPKEDILPVRRPDLDNMGKLVCDSLNELLIAEDAQITTLNIKKRWTTKEYGYITITLEEDKL